MELYEYYNDKISYDENLKEIFNIGKAHSVMKLQTKIDSVKIYLSVLHTALSAAQIAELVFNYESGFKCGAE